MSRYIDIDKVLKELHLNHKDVIYIDKKDTAKRIEMIQSIDIVRCKECASYCGDGNKCLWGLLTVDMGYCHHGYRGGDCITKQTEPQTEREGK